MSVRCDLALVDVLSLSASSSMSSESCLPPAFTCRWVDQFRLVIWLEWARGHPELLVLPVLFLLAGLEALVYAVDGCDM